MPPRPASRIPLLTESLELRYAGHRVIHHIRTCTDDIKQKMIRNSQLLLSIISSLLLIGVGLIGFGKKTGLAATM